MRILTACCKLYGLVVKWPLKGGGVSHYCMDLLPSYLCLRENSNLRFESVQHGWFLSRWGNPDAHHASVGRAKEWTDFWNAWMQDSRSQKGYSSFRITQFAIRAKEYLCLGVLPWNLVITFLLNLSWFKWGSTLPIMMVLVMKVQYCDTSFTVLDYLEFWLGFQSCRAYLGVSINDLLLPNNTAHSQLAVVGMTIILLFPVIDFSCRLEHGDWVSALFIRNSCSF